MPHADDLLARNTASDDANRLLALLNQQIDAAASDPHQLDVLSLLLARLQARVQVARIRHEQVEGSRAC